MVALAIALAARSPVAQAQDLADIPVPDLIAQAPGLPPVALYTLAAKLFAAGRRDEAVVWFYIAQIRSRFRLATAPDLPPDGEPALYASLFETIGPPINQWAFCDIDRLAAEMGRALDWDRDHANATSPKDANAAALDQVRSGLIAFRANILETRADFEKDRAARCVTAR